VDQGLNLVALSTKLKPRKTYHHWTRSEKPSQDDACFAINRWTESSSGIKGESLQFVCSRSLHDGSQL